MLKNRTGETNAQNKVCGLVFRGTDRFRFTRHRSFLPSLVSPHLTWLSVVPLTLTLLSEPVRPCTERNLGVDDGSGSGSVPTVAVPIHHRDARTAEWRIRMQTSLAREVLVNHHSCKMKPRHPRVYCNTNRLVEFENGRQRSPNADSFCQE
ncbi:hypothetical protein GQ607_007545 [Colletotrichum asianum]|uniref:Uncharacterized protein n=1 Tax=Colletotrichum asianum TaxID=702518 RepID=A0A8H3WIS2_9PEZI|nr:hypothetical protein GQ607_007545 [Colletotrichum asianum]